MPEWSGTTSAVAEGFTIAVLGDVHQGDPPTIAARRGEFGATLLHRLVARLNRFIRPDLVLVVGDLIDLPDAERAGRDLAELRGVLDRLACPWLAVPGNHDPAPARFYETFERPAEAVDFEARGVTVRVLPFVDAEAPGYHATRSEADLARLRAARGDGFEGTVIAMQHVPVRPHGAELRHTFTNLDEVLEATRAGGVDLCVAGHSHQPCEPVRDGRCRFFAVGALCEHPHPYALVTLAGDDRVSVRHEHLAMPREWGLVDYHSHTQFAYCAKDVHTQRSPAFAETMGLRAMALTEHSGQLYVEREDYWSGRFCAGDAWRGSEASWRIDDYFETARAVQGPTVMLGLEVDADFHGELVLDEAHREPTELLIGAVHFLPESVKPSEQRDADRFTEQFQRVTQRLCGTGVDVLAHPFRIYRRAGLTVPKHLYPWLARQLAATGVAAEINYHTNEPHPEFVRLCLEMGVKLSFASDAHELWEVGEFYPHLKLLESLGVHGNPSDVLVDLVGTRATESTGRQQTGREGKSRVSTSAS